MANPDNRPTTLPLLVSWFLTFSGAASLAWNGKIDKSHPLFWALAASLFMYVLHPYFFIQTGKISRPYHLYHYVGDDYPKALWLGCIGTASLLAGYATSARLASHRARNPGGSPRISIDNRAAGRAAVASIALLAIAIVGYGAFTASAGESFTHALTQGARKGSADGTAYLYLAPQLIGPSSMLLLYSRLKSGRTRLPVIALLAVSALLFLPTGQRFAVLTSTIPTIIYWGYAKGVRLRFIPFLMIVVVGLATVIATRDAGAAGGTTLTQSVSRTAEDPNAAIEDFFTGADTEMIDALALETSVVPERLGHSPGWTVWATVAAPVPSMIWPQKPVTADGILNQALLGVDRGNASVAYGFIGELYYDSGIFGIVVGMSLAGAGMMVLWRHHRRLNTLEFGMVYFALLPLTVTLLRGSLALVLGPALFTAGPILIFYLVNRSVDLRSAEERCAR